MNLWIIHFDQTSMKELPLYLKISTIATSLRVWIQILRI